ncbi:MAG: tyrosine--tRNA ligase [Candidatus Yanofskybacteria bacterium RIFCSPHIGHO2_01_FULL_43_42]|uniref:Tyrosine--tRNA ligase n=1 Tax=Candidatus Taylorbacteria bacterium RIFCSPLOWO2_01_FULL_44_26 TaxID=1802318 RepID=A0A1G2N4Q3_9BACT|nr:MAG: tyrosine--tRNA ligase [Candidatus Yanofskybacteria bacterium RIFCSPHIGHO2_01_FULL_43_42]OHA31003.1 MAG: tyrosine--tRNA ligase [Candidatus Taylorbacteria bacterium RIFCSPLOWO2_01_FULL_44_26]
MKKSLSKSNKIEELLNRGVEEIVDRPNLENKLKSGKQLRIKLGIDPTSLNIHLGRSIPLLKLRDFQELGHKIILIIGDFTGLIGDTSDKDSERPMLSKETVRENLKTYIKQVAKIIDVDSAEIQHNSKWLDKLGYMDIGRQADVFSLNEFISRENIGRRLEDGKRVSLRELLYPLMQGYDSVEVRADVEIGGTDQRFNLLAGRDIQRLYGQEPQDILTNPLIEGLDGRKMSSSFGNTVNLFDTPNDMFGKIMSLKDDLIIKSFILLTRVEMKTINEYKTHLKDDANPRDIKMKLALEIVRMYHSKEDANDAQDYFVKTFTQKEIPLDMPQFKPTAYNIVLILVESKLVTSKSEARRILDHGGVKIDSKVVKEINYVVPSGSVLQKGKINFLKIL